MISEVLGSVPVGLWTWLAWVYKVELPILPILLSLEAFPCLLLSVYIHLFSCSKHRLCSQNCHFGKRSFGAWFMTRGAVHHQDESQASQICICWRIWVWENLKSETGYVLFTRFSGSGQYFPESPVRLSGTDRGSGRAPGSAAAHPAPLASDISQSYEG